jgi:cystathionine gamma-lyase
MEHGPSTRAVHAGRTPGEPGAPIAPQPTLAAPFELPGAPDSAPYGYGRYGNPTWTALEAALADLEGGPALVFASGMASIDATLRALGGPVVAPGDGYPGIRELASEARFVPASTEAFVEACPGAGVVWVETPSNPRLDVVDIAAVAAAAHDAGALLVVDNSLATPLGQTPLALGADVVVAAGTKALAGHSDVLLGYVAARDPAIAERILKVRGQAGMIAGAFDAWLVHRSLATLALRLSRMSETAAAVFALLVERGVEAFHPSTSSVFARQMRLGGPLVSFDLGTESRADAFLDASVLITQATSFGGVHTSAERRGRWGTDAVGPGFIRLSCGIEDTADVLEDVKNTLSGV